ncbi:MAG: ribose-5-phosphate isomerase RpiA [Thermoleophilia bacterium]|nr:ribose-5-phosphate isomerase RpiA [Thermoleophilia bacterium]
MSADAAKRAAGRRAAELVSDGMTVGLGTGTTVAHTIIALGERALDITCVATSHATEQLATQVGLRLVAPDEVESLDIAVDGADEVDSELNLTKGGGGALMREKIVASLTERFVVVADDSKLVGRLGDFGTPIELMPFAPRTVARAIERLGAREVLLREGPSDNGNLLADARFGTIEDPAALSAALDAVPGLAGHGIFLGSMVERVLVDGPGGARTITAASRS